LKSLHCLLFTIFFFVTYNSEIIASENKFTARIKRLNTINESVLWDSVKTLFKEIYVLPNKADRFRTAKEIAETVKNRDDRVYSYSLTHLGQFADSGNLSYLKNALSILNKYDISFELGWIHQVFSQYYLEKGKLDSSMHHILISRDIFEQLGEKIHSVIVIHTMGDLYYSVGLYNEAEKEYLSLLNKYPKESFDNNWRFVVVNNNLGLIEYKRKNYKKGIEYFKISLNYRLNQGKEESKSASVIYIHNRIGEILLEEGRLSKAKEYLLKAEYLSIETGMHNFLNDNYFLQSKWFLKQNILDSAHYFAEKINLHPNIADDSYSFLKNFFLLKGEIHWLKGDYKISSEYYRKAEEFSRKNEVETRKFKSLIILAKNNHEKMNNKLKAANRELNIFIIAFSIIVLITIITLLLYFRLYRSNLKLVENTLRIAENKEKCTDFLQSDTNQQDENMVSIFNKLKKLMEDEKLFLEKEIDLEKVAQFLGTNRTYLSKALNGELKINFNQYINSLRINEAIQLIKNGEAEKITIEGLALHVGFRHRSVFGRAFQKETGVTPSFFIDNYKEISS